MRAIGIKNSTSNQAGFSLVELMVVVAIIGILAAMSVGGVSKQIAKARQSEAKTNLAALYTSEAVFKAEYNIYTTDFAVMGLKYEGNIRYATGFNANTVPIATAALNGYTGAPLAAVGLGTFHTLGYCTAVGVANCTSILTNGVAGPAPTAAAVVNNATTSFLAEASANIYTAAQVDTWTISNAKIIANAVDGLQ